MKPTMLKDKSVQVSTKSIAVVSGKGGSGKTLLATAMATELASVGNSVLLVDADLGTGGLTYYLGFTEFSRARLGLTDVLLGNLDEEQLKLSFHKNKTKQGWESSLALLPVGNHKLALEADYEGGYISMSPLSMILEKYSHNFDAIIIDCRGGIDPHSLNICEIADEILVVVETDAASIRATQHLTDTLGRRGFSPKIIGFALNKVMDNPDTLASAGRTFFGTNYLGAVPFELETTRDFIQGKLPRAGSLFRRQANLIASQCFENLTHMDDYRYLSDSDFEQTSTEAPEVKTGRLAVAMMWMLAFMYVTYVTTLAFQGNIPENWWVFEDRRLFEKLLFENIMKTVIGMYGILILTLISLSPRLLRFLGRVIGFYQEGFIAVIKTLIR